MKNLLSFKSTEESSDGQPCPCREDIKELLRKFHGDLLGHCAMPSVPEDEKSAETEKEVPEEAPPTPSVGEKLLQLVLKSKTDEVKEKEVTFEKPCKFDYPLISQGYIGKFCIVLILSEWQPPWNHQK